MESKAVDRQPTAVLRFNGLTEAEEERLAILSEECGEVVTAVSKILRHGYHSPPWDNLGDLQRAIADVLWAVEQMERRGDVNPITLAELVESKKQRSVRFLHHQGK